MVVLWHFTVSIQTTEQSTRRLEKTNIILEMMMAIKLFIFIFTLLMVVSKSDQQFESESFFRPVVRVLPGGILTPELYQRIDDEISALQKSLTEGTQKGTLSREEIWDFGMKILQKSQGQNRMEELQNQLNAGRYRSLKEMKEDERTLIRMVEIAKQGGDPRLVEQNRW